MNIYKVDRLNKNRGLFYYQLIPFALIKVNHRIRFATATDVFATALYTKNSQRLF